MSEPSTELVHVPADTAMMDKATDSWTVVLQAVADLSLKIADSDFVPESHRGNRGQVAAVILHGRELGLPPMTALASTHVIKGKPSISAEAMRALILQAGHELAIVESTTARCTIKGRRSALNEWTTVTWTTDDARQAGLLNGSGWKNYPRQMLTARATAELARMIFPDVIHGMRAVEEMDDATPWEPSTAVEQTAAPAKTTVRRKTKKASETPETPVASTPNPDPVAEQQPDQGTPERRRPDLPSRNRRPAEAARTADADPPGPQPAEGSEAGGNSVPPVSDHIPTVEEQQAEIRQLSDQKRRLNDDQDQDQAADEDGGIIDTADRKPISHGQRGFLMAQFKRLGIEDRDMRLSYSMALTGRDDLESSNQLTFAQASELIKKLEQFRDLDALEVEVNGQETLT